MDFVYSIQKAVKLSRVLERNEAITTQLRDEIIKIFQAEVQVCLLLLSL